jgi:hypothetical protein
VDTNSMVVDTNGMVVVDSMSNMSSIRVNMCSGVNLRIGGIFQIRMYFRVDVVTRD